MPAPAAGVARIKAKGDMLEVSFSRREVEQMEDGAAPSTKVLVKWDIDPVNMMPQIADLEGHSSIVMDLGAAQVVQAAQEEPQVIEKEATTASAKEELQRLANEVEEAESQVESLPSESLPESSPESEGESLSSLSAAELPVDLPEILLNEVFEDKTFVNYWSSARQKLCPARIYGHAHFPDVRKPKLPHYDVLVGAKRQLREKALCPKQASEGHSILQFLH